jgi:hypothetical protein
MLDATARAVELTASRPAAGRGWMLGAWRAMGRARRDGAGKRKGGLRRPGTLLGQPAQPRVVILGMVELHTS